MGDFHLYDFQVEDVAKLKDRNGRLIASEMGAGKTYVGWELDFQCCQDDHANTLWVAPMQTLESSVEKLRQMGIDAPVVILDPKDREGSWARFKRLRGGIFMVHWEAIRLMPYLHEDREIKFWDHVVGDEIHKIQNRKAQATRALKKIKAGYRTGMSGTPVTGAPDKYWSVLNWLYPDVFRSYWGFQKAYCETEIVYPQGYTKVVGPKNEHLLLEAVNPFYVRHLKREQCCPHHPQGVMPWLPDKYYDKVWVDLHPAQRKAYESMRKEMIAWVGKQEDTPLTAGVVVAQMMRLQQFAIAMANIADDGSVFLDEPSSKADALMHILEDNPTEPIVVFTQFNRFIHLLERRLQAAKIPYVCYTGENRGTREEDKRRFMAGDARVFLGNISAGGVGLDGLQSVSSTVVFTDRLWSPALNNQAEDRLWRDGQQNAVQVIDIMARNTVDLGRHQRLEMKWDWIRRLLGDK